MEGARLGCHFPLCGFVSLAKPSHRLITVGRVTWGRSPAASEAGGDQGSLEGRHVTFLGVLLKSNFILLTVLPKFLSSGVARQASAA